MKAYGKKKTIVPGRRSADENTSGRRRIYELCCPETKNGRAKARAEGKAAVAEDIE
jgi:hypothetical protein